MTKRHTDTVSSRFFYFELRRSLLGLVLTISALTVSGCVGCGANGNNGSSLLASLSGNGSGNQSQSGENVLCSIKSGSNDLSIPRTAQRFDITINGEADGEPFSQQSGFLIVQPTVETAGDIGLDNVTNTRDIGFFSVANPLTDPEAGAISFATNTAILAAQQRGDVPAQLAAVDVAYRRYRWDNRHLDGND